LGNGNFGLPYEPPPSMLGKLRENFSLLGYLFLCLTFINVNDFSRYIDRLVAVKNLGALQYQRKFFRLAHLIDDFFQLLENITGHFAFFLTQLLLLVRHGALIIYITPLEITFQISSFVFLKQRPLLIQLTFEPLQLLFLFQKICLGFLHLSLKSVLGALSRLRL